MEALIDFAAVGGAIVFSLGVALSLEWFALNTLIKMMPLQQPAMLAEEVTSEKPAAGPTLVPARSPAANARCDRSGGNRSRPKLFREPSRAD
jgi:hypothetical protein